MPRVSQVVLQDRSRHDTVPLSDYRFPKKNSATMLYRYTVYVLYNYILHILYILHNLHNIYTYIYIHTCILLYVGDSLPSHGSYDQTAARAARQLLCQNCGGWSWAVQGSLKISGVWHYIVIQIQLYNAINEII